MYHRRASHVWETLAITMANLKQATLLKKGLPPVFHWNNVAPSASTKLSFPDPKHFMCLLFLNAAWYVKNMIASLTFTKKLQSTIKFQNKCDHHFNNLQCKHQLFVKYYMPNKINAVKSGNNKIQAHIILPSHKLQQRVRRVEKEKSFLVSLSLGCQSIHESYHEFLSVNLNFTWEKERMRRLTETLEFHILKGRREQLGNLSFCTLPYILRGLERLLFSFKFQKLRLGCLYSQNLF